MTSVAFRFVSKPNVDFNKLCGLLYEATGEKVAGFADKHNPKLSEDRKFATCLESFIEHEPLTFQPLVMSHLHFVAIAVCSEIDVADVMMCASELACLSAPSKARGLSVVIMSGTLNAWKAAVTSGIARDTTRDVFQHAMGAFCAEGYAVVFAKNGLIR